MAITSDIVIIGGGVIGLTTAYFLAREKVRVTVLDRQDFGREASWAGAGIIPPGNPQYAVSPFDRLRSLSFSLFPNLSAELLNRTGIDNGFIQSGGLEFSPSENAALPEEWRGAGINVQALTEAQSREREPALANGLGNVSYIPEMAQLRNPRHIKALIAACTLLNVDLRCQCPAREWLVQGSHIHGLRSEQKTFHAGQYILATGAWTDPLLAGLRLQLGIHPVRGQIALLHHSPPLFHHVLIWGDRYLVPRPDGKVLVGSTEEHVGYQNRTTAGAQRELLTLACRLVPGLADAEVERCWAGLRPGNRDGLPFIGPIPGYDNILVGAGHFRAGIQLSPGTAQLLKEMILQQPMTLNPSPFRLDRVTKPG
jgi:glycine oxidase